MFFKQLFSSKNYLDKKEPTNNVFSWGQSSGNQMSSTVKMILD
ncbi:hypothetical protein CMALT394_410065 [Carnobacterium maltaromaticum]|nr:hypothetical protein CMALT394_410065 [Carnobacterium maltaromaticum]